MKSLLIYINPKKTFADGNNDSRIVEVQIDNSLQYFKPEDILLATNFDYEYHGVKSMVVSDDLYCDADSTGKASKINVVIYLIENGLINDLIWFHDFDAFQISPIELEIKEDVGFTNYEWKNQWNTGSFFFRKDGLQIFKWIQDVVYKYKINEEPALGMLTDNNLNNINTLYKKLNVTYNIGRRSTRTLIQMADKPIKVVHFPPSYKNVFDKFKPFITPELTQLINEKFNYLS